ARGIKATERCITNGGLTGGKGCLSNGGGGLPEVEAFNVWFDGGMMVVGYNLMVVDDDLDDRVK
ncbi:hypothetical protein Tco_1230549, partial [Tanacetum coccineum]